MFKKNISEHELLLKRVKDCPLFSELSGREIKYLLGASHIREYSSDEKIFNQGTIGLCFYIIVTGKVNIIAEGDGKIITLKEYNDGAFFSEVHLFSETNHTVSCVAKEVTKLIIFAKPDLEDIVKINPRLGNKILLRFLDFFGQKLDELYRENTKLKEKPLA
jgi:CRP/FNR family cyclic AMP-dependent transcriptional regulator